MAGNHAGAIKAAARRVGVPVDVYLAKVASGQKFCWMCRLWKLISTFALDRTRYDGHASKCLLCGKGGPKQLKLLRPTPAELQRIRYAKDSEYRFRTRQRVYARKRRIRPMPAEGRDALTERFGGRCAYCCSPATTWDHIVPVADGGRTEPGNILPACASCNSTKKTMNVFDFIDRYGVQLTSELMNELNMAVAWGQLEPPDCLGMV